MVIAPTEIVRYLTSKGVSRNHAEGVAANILGESSGDPSAIGDAGTSFGLIQWHGPRGDAMKASVGPNWSSDWQGQLDYLLTEPDAAGYFRASFDTPQEASVTFTKEVERPANADQRAQERLSYFEDASYVPTTQRQMAMPQNPGLLNAPAEPLLGTPAAQGVLGVPVPQPQVNPFLVAAANMGAPNTPWSVNLARGLAAAQAAQNQSSQQAFQSQLANTRLGLEADRLGLDREKLAEQQRIQRAQMDLQRRKLQQATVASQAQQQQLIAARQAAARHVLDTTGNRALADLILAGGADNDLIKTMGLQEPLDIQQKISAGNTLRTGYMRDTADDRERIGYWNQVVDIDPAKATGPEQRQLVIAFAKMMEPTSVVMREEGEAIELAGTTSPYLKSIWRSFVNNTLTEDRIKQIIDRMERMARSAQENVEKTHSEYLGRAEAAGIGDQIPSAPEPFLVRPEFGSETDEDAAILRATEILGG